VDLEIVPAGVTGRTMAWQKVPVVTKSPEEAAGYFRCLAPFLSADNPVSSALTSPAPNNQV
jgi:hypothetical protein